MSRDRIRLLLTVDTVGGIWQYALDLARALAPHGVDTVLALTGPPASDPQRQDARAIPGVRVVDTGIALDWLAADAATLSDGGRRIAAIAASEAVDIVQLNAPALAAGGAFRQPVVAVAHSCVATWWQAVRSGPLPSDLAWRARLHGAGLRRAARVVAPTQAFADATQATYRLETRPTAVLNGRALAPGPTAAMHDFAFTAGRLWDAGKNVAVLDQIAARLAIPFKAAGATTGPQGEAVTCDHLCLLGRVEDRAIARHLAAQPVFVSAARYEPFGLAVLEAAAAGCPLILSDIPTFREIWGDSALFIDPDDVDGFARMIDRVVGDIPLRRHLGAQARARAHRYRPDAMASGMLAIYRDLLSQRDAVTRVGTPEMAA
ncbi:MAG TPA: glycosyltransferase family 4 protein [Sphingomonas sp.]|jgi:glycosyltransferase involved in cell wall biosynthesis|uniref:glycosyltransferase family 4 protein n=1 Tax=Sphingomonas sp. TaxID=28214 RepID=UPI002ED9AFD9